MAIQTLNNNDSANVYRGVYFERTTDFNVNDTSSNSFLFARLGGNNQPHNNIQPTYAVNYWQRVA